MPNSDDPFLRADSTLMRPRPGGGKHGAGDATRSRPVAPFVADTDALSAAVRAQLGVGLNPLVQAASPLLLLTGQMRGAISPMDVTGIRRHVLEEIRRFEENARSAGVQNEIILAARYALCAGMDEAVLSTPWGSQSEWATHTLLVTLHRETWGGEKFFEMLDRISADPSRYIDLMELQYLCIAFGFGGKYHRQDRGHHHESLADVQHGLYRKIRHHRGTTDPELSLRWRGLEDRRNRLIRYVPWWVVGAAGLAILAVAFTAYYASLARLALPVHAELAKVGLEEFSPPPEPVKPLPGPTLKQLLAPEEAARAVSVEEKGNRTLITLLGADLFESGSVAVNPSYNQTLQRLAEAMNKVPGRVVVSGHTDDQPIRSLRYQNNFELSRERAVSVVDILKRTIDNPARLSFNGVGSSSPLYRPESTPENRSRNRRVEIVHVRGT
jgi:type VI secretion system protein ImpK